MEQKIREIIEGLIGKEKADKLPDSADAKELIDRIAASISAGSSDAWRRSRRR